MTFQIQCKIIYVISSIFYILYFSNIDEFNPNFINLNKSLDNNKIWKLEESKNNSINLHITEEIDNNYFLELNEIESDINEPLIINK